MTVIFWLAYLIIWATGEAALWVAPQIPKFTLAGHLVVQALIFAGATIVAGIALENHGEW